MIRADGLVECWGGGLERGEFAVRDYRETPGGFEENVPPPKVSFDQIRADDLHFFGRDSSKHWWVWGEPIGWLQWGIEQFEPQPVRDIVHQGRWMCAAYESGGAECSGRFTNSQVPGWLRRCPELEPNCRRLVPPSHAPYSRRFGGDFRALYWVDEGLYGLTEGGAFEFLEQYHSSSSPESAVLWTSVPRNEEFREAVGRVKDVRFVQMSCLALDRDPHCCGVDVARQVRCFGATRTRPAWWLKDVNLVDREPVGEYRQVAVGPEHGCAITMGGALRCWHADDESNWSLAGGDLPEWPVAETRPSPYFVLPPASSAPP